MDFYYLTDNVTQKAKGPPFVILDSGTKTCDWEDDCRGLKVKQ